MLQRFLHHEGKMGALGAVAIKIFPFVFVFLKSFGEHVLSLVDLHPDLGEVRDLEGCSVLFDECFEVKAIEPEITFLYFQAFLWKIEGLLNKIHIGIVQGV
jgi:hypothetical protein